MSEAGSPTSTDAVVLAIDAGTTGVRAIAVDREGRLIDRAYREFTQFFPEPGLVEHDADEIWETTRTVLAELVGRLDAPIAAVGITDQRETAVAWDARTGRPRHRAIVWQDRRTAPRCDELRAAGELERIRRLTGLVLDPYFSASKWEWMLGPGGVVADESLRLGTVDSWLVWNLTGGSLDSGARHLTDSSNASRTMLYDIGENRWSEELCELFGVPQGALAEVVPSAGQVAVTAAGCGLSEGIPISGIAGDQQASLFGQACLSAGMAKNTYGTGSFVLMNIGTTLPEPVDGLLSTVAWTLPGELIGAEAGTTVTHYALEGAIFVTGAAVQWLRDGLGVIEHAAELGPLAESVPDAGGLVVVPAFTGLGSPWWDPYARGTVLGISRGVGRAHLARAVIESMALQTRDVVDAMTAATGTPLAELRIDGGAAVMDLLVQLQADQLGVPVARSTTNETTALGAAYLAGLGVGIWSDVDDVGGHWHHDARVTPAQDRGPADALHAQWLRGVERARS